MHPEEIKAKIRMTGITLEELSLQYCKGASNVRQALFFRHCPSGERAIIQCLKQHYDIEPHAIWPNRYDEKGNRTIGHSRSNNTKSNADGHRQKDAAA